MEDSPDIQNIVLELNEFESIIPIISSEYLPFLGVISGILTIIFYYSFNYWNENKIQVIDTIESKINDLKQTLSIYTNKFLLYLNMQGSAVKTTNKI